MISRQLADGEIVVCIPLPDRPCPTLAPSASGAWAGGTRIRRRRPGLYYHSQFEFEGLRVRTHDSKRVPFGYNPSDGGVLLAWPGVAHTDLILQRILPRQTMHRRTHTRIHALVRVIRDRRARGVAVDDVAFVVGYFGVLEAISIGDGDGLVAVRLGSRTVTGHLASGSEDKAGWSGGSTVVDVPTTCGE